MSRIIKAGVVKPSSVIEFQEQKNHQNLSENRIPNAIYSKYYHFFRIWVPNVDTQWCWYYRNREYLRRASKHFKEEVFFIHFIVTDGSIWIDKWKNRECHFCKTDVHKSSTGKIIIQNELLYLELLIQCSEIQKQVYSRKSNIFGMERLP